MTQMELDMQFVQGLRLVHSTHKDSAEQLRLLLDEVIKQKYGSSKMLCNTLHKKYTIEEQVLSDHSSGSGSKKSKSSNSSKHSKSSKNNSPITIQDSGDFQSDDNLALEILEDDLTCVVCKGMDVGARNRLVECMECHNLYHQECHAPAIQDSQIDEPKIIWYCSMCFKIQKAKERNNWNNSPKTVTETKSKESRRSSSSYSRKERHKSSSSSSNQNQSSNGGSSNSKIPSINIVSAADRRLKDMMKKAKQDKRSSSSGSKHSSSSSKNSHDKSYKNKSE